MHPQERSSPTLADLALEAGVSPALASMCLRGIPGPAERTREHVREVAARIGYRTNKAASILAQKRAPRIGVVFALRSAFHARMVEELYGTAEQAGFEVLLSAVTVRRTADQAVDSLLESRCLAIILIGSCATPQALSVVDNTVPTIVIGDAPVGPNISSVHADAEGGVHMAVLRLAELGHHDIAFVTGPNESGPRTSETDKRMRGYLQGMDDAGLAKHTRMIAGGDTMESGIVTSRHLFKHNDLPSAVIAFNDECAAGLVFGFKIRGVDVPGDVSVVGFDDSGFADRSGLELTTLHQDVPNIARLSIDEAVRRVAHFADAPVHQVLPLTLVERLSTDRPRARP